MTIPTLNIREACNKANQKMANKHSPFIFNEWYVAAFSHEIKHELFSRKLLNKKVVLYRSTDGEVVALQDRCAHRSFPLSKSTLDGDEIICGYHGIRYDKSGDMIEIPSQKRCPHGMGIKKYATLEKGGLIWIWLGDQSRADASKLFDLEWLDHEQWTSSQGYFLHPGNYVSMHENLMDLTHLSFLHSDTIGTPDFATAPYKTELNHGHYKLIREVVPTVLAPVWADSTDIGYVDTAARITTSEFLSPALHQVSAKFYDTALGEDAHIYQIRTAHILTPETNGTMHYFIVHGRNFAQEDKVLGEKMHRGLFAAFEEDVIGLGALETMLDDLEDDHFEMSIASDSAAIATRIYLKERAEQEQ
ncbi:aromatic ring-hydroxylating dioxygenase subunit alpha [Acinetobacter gerneri]|jgi:vanillate O-demethylase monooxygenase subunit|uniref:aromatic ring-hydroxylating dioxygenase subunit alpha n=1 Tax=Acinetobacter gerneri TaxID=202952 RepID=UPI0023F2F4AC|nr:aromatic ring-hydroxylating dioxygenase subunit alpha [Acinetobacter gerneri]MCH4245424.1 aromatic ring-hydroxylating dioxygenase subunit alpha [Acinetobacter gerneri]